MKVPEIVRFRKRVENLVNATWDQAELMHFIEYIPNQRYGRHHDWVNGEEKTIQGPRLWTLLMVCILLFLTVSTEMYLVSRILLFFA